MLLSQEPQSCFGFEVLLFTGNFGLGSGTFPAFPVLIHKNVRSDADGIRLPKISKQRKYAGGRPAARITEPFRFSKYSEENPGIVSGMRLPGSVRSKKNMPAGSR